MDDGIHDRMIPKASRMPEKEYEIYQGKLDWITKIFNSISLSTFMICPLSNDMNLAKMQNYYLALPKGKKDYIVLHEKIIIPEVEW